MAAGATVQVEGLDNLVRTLRKAGADIDELKDASQKAGATVIGRGHGDGRPAAPAGWPGRCAPRGWRKGCGCQWGGRRSPYAGAIHWGWPARNITAQPFLTDAAKADRTDLDARSTWRTSRRSSTG